MVGSFDIFALVHRYLSKVDCTRQSVLVMNKW